MKIVKVTWIDAVEFNHIEDAKKNPCTREAIGYLLRRDKIATAVCWLYDVRSDKDVTDDDESEGIVIPTKMVIKVEEYIESPRPNTE